MPRFYRIISIQLAKRLAGRLTLGAVFFQAAAVMVHAQATQNNGSLAKALLALPRTTNGNVTTVNSRLYGGNIQAEITAHGDVTDPNTWDRVVFNLASVNDAANAVGCGPQSKSEFDSCVQQQVSRIIGILFPASLSASVSGRDAAQNHAETFLLSTAFAIPATKGEGRRRLDIGGLVEHEWFSGGHAWQGVYNLNKIPLSFHGRYARREDSVDTNSTVISADFHPSIQIKAPVNWRVGIDARTNILYSHSSALDPSSQSTFDLGSFDMGGGVWTSVLKDFSRVRLGGATLFQGSKSHVPESWAGSQYAFLAQAMNDHRIDYDLAYGGLAGFILSDRTSINGRFIETTPVSSSPGRHSSRLAMASFAYLLGGVTPIDVGYKISTGNGFKAHSIFVQGNFRW